MVRRWDKSRRAAGEATLPPSAVQNNCSKIKLVAIAASTGGPGILADILGKLPADLSVPVVIVQHITTGFGQGLATWLNQQTPLKVKLADHAEKPNPGQVLIAPDDRHMTINSMGLIVLGNEPPMHRLRPAADHLFHSIAKVYGATAIGVILSGMGCDGAKGLFAMRQSGAHTIAQDKATCVVFGMPAVAIELGAAEQILPAQQIAKALEALVQETVVPVQQSFKEATAFKPSKAGVFHLTKIEEAIELIGPENDKIKVLRAVLPYALSIGKANVGALLAIDSRGKHMTVVVRHGLADEVIEQLTKGDLSHMLLQGQWLRVKRKPRQDIPDTILGRHNLQSLLGLPLEFGGNVLGAIVVGYKTSSNQTLRKKQAEQLAALAQLVALFMDNLRLRTGKPWHEPKEPPPETNRNSAVDELENLLEAVMSAEEEVVNQNTDLDLLNTLSSEVTSTLQLGQVLEIAVRQTRQALKAEIGWCYLLEDDFLVLCEDQGLSESYVQGMQYIKPGNGAEGMAFSRNEPIFKDNMLFHSGQARKLVQAEGLHNVAAAPLVHQGKPFGALAIAHRQDQPWSPRDRRMFVSISRQVAQALINSRAFTEAQERAESWQANYDHLKQLNLQLTQQAATLERRVKELQQAKQHIWLALAASSKARYNPGDKEIDTTLKRVVGKLEQEEAEEQNHRNPKQELVP